MERFIPATMELHAATVSLISGYRFHSSKRDNEQSSLTPFLAILHVVVEYAIGLDYFTHSLQMLVSHIDLVLLESPDIQNRDSKCVFDQSRATVISVSEWISRKIL